MGVTLVTNSNIESLLKKYDSVRECSSCSHGFMVPSQTVYKKAYGNVTLEIEGVPIFQCLDCKEITYATGSLVKAIKEAKLNYDTLGEVVYKYE
ncbi:YgiT-type zinc finger protein [Sporosarcina sp. HYO08]|uniref:YgiT-type zinc finger protein n=1 Tax=Sporosarcina sp. HYO08 TaxID=1759557 RepID=UPI00079AD3E9|nr:YgiT-type zinc finger protein [Sporosarcina sp. HYO08]KXH87005.1 hypothetical protein AU377_00020 [Sporosarcina sp. HYO08]